jgi:Mobilization protein NikA
MTAMTQRNPDGQQAHLDAAEGSVGERPRDQSRRRLVAIISVRFTPDEEQAVRRTAQKVGTSVSTFIRQAALRAAGYREQNAEAPPRTATVTTSTTSFASMTETLTSNTRVQVSAPPWVVHGG